jgi:TolB protein
MTSRCIRRSRSAGLGRLMTAAVLCACSPVASSPPTSRLPAASPTVAPAATAAATASPRSTRREHRTSEVIAVGRPISLDDLSGRILFDDFEDVYAMDVDGSNVVMVAGDPAGPEFDAAWSPDGRWVVYRDSTRGINSNDEIFVSRADGSERRNLTSHPANDWGPDWSPDGETIIFNSDRDGEIRGFAVNADGTNLRGLGIDAWVEYPSFSPDGTRISFMGALGNNYELFAGNLETGAVTRLTNAPGHDAWSAWSPAGETIAFSSVRDDCRFAPPDQDCWRGEGADDEHSNVWLIESDGSNLRRVTPENGHFVAWSPDGDYLLISGRALYVVRPDGTGRIELRAEGMPRALGGIPDWR